MIFLGTAYYREKAKGLADNSLWVYSYEELQEEWLRDLIALCDHINELQKVIEGNHTSIEISIKVLGEHLAEQKRENAELRERAEEAERMLCDAMLYLEQWPSACKMVSEIDEYLFPRQEGGKE